MFESDSLCLCVLVYGNCVLERPKFQNPSFHFKEKGGGGAARKIFKTPKKSKVCRQGERFMTVAVAKASHLFSLSCSDPWKQIRRAVLKDNIGTQLALHLLHHPAPPRLSGIIFFFWKEAKNMFDRPFY